MKSLSPGPVRYLQRSLASYPKITPEELFNGMIDDLSHDGDIDLAMQKAFRWGFVDGTGDQTPGLRDLIKRVRGDRTQLLGSLDIGEDEYSRARPETSDDAPASELRHDEALHHRMGPNTDAIKMAGRLKDMERSLRAIENLHDLQKLDVQLMQEVLTDHEREWIDQWARMSTTLTDEGLVVEAGDRLELTPKAVQKMGERALMAIFSCVRGWSAGDHPIRRRSHSGRLTDTSSPWEYGDPFELDLPRTLMNGLRREARGPSVRLTPKDFEVYERESQTSTATVLLIDMSRSMFYNGCWDAAKRSALALDTLMRRRFQRDDLELAGFSSRATRISLTQLPTLEWNEYSHGTNLQDGLTLSRELLRPYRTKKRQIILITDGEPTAFMQDGEVMFEDPPTDRTLSATLREVVRCTREEITINTFLMDQSPAAVDFIDSLGRLNRGRVIHANPGNLGQYVFRDFLSR